MTAIFVVGGAGSFGGDHTGSNGVLGGAASAKDFAFPGFLDTFEDIAAGAGFVIGNLTVRQGKFGFSIKVGIVGMHLEARGGNVSQPSPFKLFSYSENCRHSV